MLVKIGKIVNSHGVMGEIRIMSNSDFTDIRFKKGEKFKIKTKNDYIEVVIEKIGRHKNFYICKLEGYNNINDILKYKGLDIYAKQIDNDMLEEGEYLNADLIGLNIIDQDNNNLGKSIEIIDNPAHNLIRIKHPNKKTYLIPFNNIYITDVDLANKTILINRIGGLIDED